MKKAHATAVAMVYPNMGSVALALIVISAIGGSLVASAF